MYYVGLVVVYETLRCVICIWQPACTYSTVYPITEIQCVESVWVRILLKCLKVSVK